jgi:hypothetical protein
MNRCPVFWLRSVSGSDRGPEVGGKLAIMPRQPVEHRPLATVDRTVGEPLAFGGFGLELFQFGLKVCHGSALPVFWERAKAGVLGLPLPRGPLDNAHSAPAAQQYMGVEHIVGTQERQVGLGFIRSPSMQNAKRPQTGASLGPIICRV